MMMSDDPTRFASRRAEEPLIPSALAQHLLGATGSGPPVAELLSADTRFASPYRDYVGRDNIAPLLHVMPRVFDELFLRRDLLAPDETVTILHGTIGDNPCDVLLDERYDTRGDVSYLMLAIRPLPATKEAIRRMAALLGPGDDDVEDPPRG